MDVRKVIREWKDGPDRSDAAILAKMLEEEFERYRSRSEFTIRSDAMELPDRPARHQRPRAS